MEIKKAMEVIRENYPKTVKMVNNRYKGGFDDHSCEFGQALDVALQSMERDVEKETIYEPKTRGQKDYCPNCGAVILPSIRWTYFCDQCGQALKGAPKCYRRKKSQ